MMGKGHIKRSLILFFFTVLMAASLALIACTNENGSKYEITLDKSAISLERGESVELPYQLTLNGELDTETGVEVSVNNDGVTYDETTNKITAVKTGTSVVTISVKGHGDVSAKLTVNVPEYEITISGGDSQDVDLGSELNLEYTVKKDGVKVSGKKVVITADGECLEYTAVGNRVKFVKEGTGTVKVVLADDPEVYAVKTFNVIKSFWSSEYAVNKELMTITDSSVVIPGGSGTQYFLGVVDGGTKYVFKATLKLPSVSAISSGQSVGIGHTISKNDNSMWFGVQCADSGTGYKLLIKNFYGGWAGSDYRVAAYNGIEFESDTIECITVRDGNNYWYSLGGMVGTWTADNLSADQNTWVGVYSQENKLTVTDFTYSAEDADIEAAKEICESPVGIFTIENASVNTIVKGGSFTYVAKAIGPDSTKYPEVVWTLDKTALTAGAEGTSISADGTVTVSADAVGKITVIATCGILEKRVEVTISQEPLQQENEKLIVDGGVILNDDGSVTFSEERNGNNPSLDLDKYVEVYYSARLKDTAAGDFELAFTIKNLKSSGTPTLMASLGGRYNNFVFTHNSVSIKGMLVNAKNEYGEGTATASYAAADEYAVVIKVAGGKYVVTVNGAELQFNSTVIRRIDDYSVAQKTLFTTLAGTSCTISDITLTDKADAEFIILNGNTVAVEDGFKTNFVNGLGDSWDGKNKSITRTYYTALLPEGSYTLTMEVKFNKANTDTKFAINIGTYEYHVCNKLAGSEGCIVGEIFPGAWGGPKANTAIKTYGSSFEVTLKKIGTQMYFFIGDQLIGIANNAPSDRIVSFWTFADGTADANVEVTNVTSETGAVIITIHGDASVQVGASANYTASVLGANVEDIVWSLDTNGLSAGSATLTNGVLAMSGDAEGYVEVVATIGNVSSRYTVTASSQPANQNTAVAESVGGVKQDVANGKLIFDDADANGVASEDKYNEESTYYAILNTEENVRATVQDNFELEFTVSDYHTTAQYPKLMVSLGGVNEQFYIVYFTDGSAQIQTYTQSIESNGTPCGGQWVNSAMFANFDSSAAHTYKIECVNGHYKVYLDGTEVTGWNMNGNSRTILRNPESMVKPANIMLSTNSGTTCVITDIKLTVNSQTVSKTLADNASVNAENGDITFKYGVANWNTYDKAARIYAYDTFGENCEITFDVKFNDNVTDAKFGVKVDGGVNAYTICLSNGSIKVEVRDRWGGQNISVSDWSEALRVKITVTNGVATMTVNDTYTVNNDGITAWGILSFCTFNENSGDAEKTVTVSNVVISPAQA